MAARTCIVELTPAQRAATLCTHGMMHEDGTAFLNYGIMEAVQDDEEPTRYSVSYVICQFPQQLTRADYKRGKSVEAQKPKATFIKPRHARRICG